MTLKPLATRIPEETDREIREIMRLDRMDRSTAVRTVIEVGISEWRKQKAIELLRDGRVSFAKAAEIAKLSIWDFMDLIRQRRVQWVGLAPEDVEKEFHEAAKAESK